MLSLYIQSVLDHIEYMTLVQYALTKGWQLFIKFFRSTQIEIEKIQYIAAYIDEHFPERLKQKLHQYHERLEEREIYKHKKATT